MLNIDFIDTGLDESLVKSLDRQGLVQREVSVNTKNGVITRKQWVKATEDQKNPRNARKDEPSGEKEPTEKPSPKPKKPTLVNLDDYMSGNNGHSSGKGAMLGALKDGHSRSDIMEASKAAGVKWDESENEGINWLRANRAIQEHLGKGKQELSFKVLPDLENSKLAKEYKYHEPTEDEEHELLRYTRGETNKEVRKAQQKAASKRASLLKRFEEGKIKGKTREQVLEHAEKLANDGLYYVAKKLENYISESPNFTGTLYRGLEQDGWDYKQLEGKKVGDSVSFDSLTSWSTGDTNKFTHSTSGSGEKQKRVKLVTSGKGKNNAYIAKYSPNLEGEVLVSGSNTFKIERVEETDEEVRYYLG